MKKRIFKVDGVATAFYFNAKFKFLSKLVDKRSTVLLTDEHVYKFHQPKFAGWNVIVLKAGEQFKIQATADAIIEKLLEMGADRGTMLIGVGGGVITDLTGYVASVYMRGLSFGFVPTTLLAMVDASVGGKNGVNHGTFKNMVGTIRQPAFLLIDYSFLRTLPLAEWQNGFAEIIKHAICFDRTLFQQLEKKTLDNYQRNTAAIDLLVQRNIVLKMKVVGLDEKENGKRKLLNFGHTVGHALEMKYELSHGQAISLGMVFAAKISTVVQSFKYFDRLQRLLQSYGLPTQASVNWKKLIATMRMDKKKKGDRLNYILVDQIGRAIQKEMTFKKLEKLLNAKL